MTSAWQVPLLGVRPGASDFSPRVFERRGLVKIHFLQNITQQRHEQGDCFITSGQRHP